MTGSSVGAVAAFTDHVMPSTVMPAHQAKAVIPLLPIGVPSRRPRTDFIIGVNG
jgi:hypothetical protein